METKICRVCKIEKPLTDFHKKKPDGYKSDCKECKTKSQRDYYKKNQEKLKKQINEAKQIRINENRIRLYEYYKSHPCVDCGESNPIVLEFDHRDGVDKIDTVGQLVWDGYSWDKVQNEIDKCDVRCANCHRIRTAKQQSWYKEIFQNKG